jgi:hypothetical protein
MEFSTYADLVRQMHAVPEEKSVHALMRDRPEWRYLSRIRKKISKPGVWSEKPNETPHVVMIADKENIQCLRVGTE